MPLNSLLFAHKLEIYVCVITCMYTHLIQYQWLKFRTKHINQKYNNFFRFEKTTTFMNLIFQKSIGILASLQNTAVSQNFSNLGMSYLMFLLGLGPLSFQQQRKTALCLPMISILNHISGCCTIVN
jgi:hypothetical protein